jgi:hypothetical protein
MPTIDPAAQLALARAALHERVLRWNDQRATQLLATLEALAQASSDADLLSAFACGCLLACFRYPVPEVPPLIATFPRSTLGLRVEHHAEDLADDGDGQENVDARNNAIALWKAAALLRFAARRLG